MKSVARMTKLLENGVYGNSPGPVPSGRGTYR
jgi:hypothetical protein